MIYKKNIPRESIQKLDLLLLALETIDLNGLQSFYSISDRLSLKKILPNKVSIWQLRCNNPMRKSFIKNDIKSDEFEALIKVTSEMSKFLYPYIREILSSRDNLKNNPQYWTEFKKRYIELIQERFNTNSLRVKKLLDPELNDKFFINILLTLALCISEDGYLKLKSSLL